MVTRVCVLKKAGFDVEASHLKKDIKDNLFINGIHQLKIYQCYDIVGVSDDELQDGIDLILSEPPVDTVFVNKIPMGEGEKGFAYAYLPGQYDQRADWAEQSFATITGKAKPRINSSKMVVVSGEVSDDELNAIKNYIINPVDSHEIPLAIPSTLDQAVVVPEPVAVIDGFIHMDRDELLKLHFELGLAMSMADLEFCQEHFNSQKRNPTITEIKVLDTYWSDHCRHTTFMTTIDNIAFDNGHYVAPIKSSWDKYINSRKTIYIDREKPMCLMDIATIAVKELKKEGLLDDLDESDEINACTIKIKANIDGEIEDYLLLFKNETHNHPTEIEPFGGAATCLGGAIRDPLSGRAFVYQAMRVTGSGDPNTPVSKTIPGKLPQRKISKEACHGYSSYGNQIGLSTGKVAEIYDEGFVAKRMEVGAVIGTAPASMVRREEPTPGDIVLLLGGATGRDGLGGATGSSKEHTEESITTSGAEVQKGNAPSERKIQRLFRNPKLTAMIKRCNDFGAGGVSVAVGELCAGLDIDLNAVPLKYDGLDGTEIAISESQERMACVIEAHNYENFLKLAKEENLDAVKIADVTDTNRLKMVWRDQVVVDLCRDFLNTAGVRQSTDVAVEAPLEKDLFAEMTKSKVKPTLSDSLTSLMNNINFSSQKGMGEWFDGTIGKASVLMPFGGRNQLTPSVGMAARLAVAPKNTTTASLMAYGYNPRIAKWSPYHGGMYAVLQSVAAIVAMGGDYSKARLSLQEYFPKLRNEPYRWGMPLSALLGAYEVQSQLKIPAIGGKDSMSGSFMDLDVPPTLISFAVDVVDDSMVMSNELKAAGHDLVLLATDVDDKLVPNFEQFKVNADLVHKLNEAGYLKAAMPLEEGGMAYTAVLSALGNEIGVDFKDISLERLMAPMYGSFLLELEGDYSSVLGDSGEVIAVTSGGKKIKYGKEAIPIESIIKNYLAPMENVYPTHTDSKAKPVTVPMWEKQVSQSNPIAGKPKVIIPVFPGTNCEYDSAKAFTDAGADPSVFIVNNQTPDKLKESIETLSKYIKESQIIMLPGGFSAGDEPDGSAKFITAIFRNQQISDAVAEHLEVKKGLILGVCNGFQALIKLGLVPYGKIVPMTETSPTLTYNEIGRHISTITRTKVVSKLSPWFAEAELGDVHSVPVSHGEGRFVASEEDIKEMMVDGQIATQYVDMDDLPTMVSPYNPNGSLYAIEGITSKDGLVLGKMGHSERYDKGLFKNVTGNYEQGIFNSGVKYFK